MPRILKFISFAAIAFLAGAITQRLYYEDQLEARRARAMNPSSAFPLSEEAFVSTKKAAEGGDCEAMRRLYLHYGSRSQQLASSQHWLRRSARCSSFDSVRDLAMEIVEQGRLDEAEELQRLLVIVQQRDPAQADYLAKHFEGKRQSALAGSRPAN